MPTSPSQPRDGTPSKKRKSDVSTPGSLPNPLVNHNVVFLFIPNIIGYTRVLLAGSSLYFMRWHPKYCTWLYIISCLLDAFDGMAARRFGQGMCYIFSLWHTADVYCSNQIWCRIRYGHRSMYNCLSSLLFMLCISLVYCLFPDDYFCGSCIALHAYVQVFPSLRGLSFSLTTCV